MLNTDINIDMTNKLTAVIMTVHIVTTHVYTVLRLPLWTSPVWLSGLELGRRNLCRLIWRWYEETHAYIYRKNTTKRDQLILKTL